MYNDLARDKYTELIECIENSDINATKARSLGVIILRRLEKYYRHILELDSMEPFSELLAVRSYVEENINNLDSDVLSRYIVLCNETGAIVGEADEVEIFTEEQILAISKKYYEEIQEVEGNQCRIFLSRCRRSSPNSSAWMRAPSQRTLPSRRIWARTAWIWWSWLWLWKMSSRSARSARTS